VLGIDSLNEVADDSDKDKEQQRLQQEKEEFRLLEEELHKLQNDQSPEIRASADELIAVEEDEYVRHHEILVTSLLKCTALVPPSLDQLKLLLHFRLILHHKVHLNY
jgi:hypothetical protein